MQGLWADGWFYISSLGLLVSGALFFVLLGQYRAAVEAADRREGDAEAPATVRPVYIPDEELEPRPVVSAAPAPAPAPAPVPVAAAAPAPTPAPSAKESSSGGLSPAIAFLQGIKTEMDELRGQVKDLSSAVASRDEALIERLSELTAAVEALRSAAPAAAPEPKKARKAAPAPEPAPAPAPEPAPAPAAVAAAEMPELVAPAKAVEAPVPAPAPASAPAASLADAGLKIEPTSVPAPKTEPVVSPDATIRIEPAKAEEPAAEDKPRRGPVWPV